MTFESEKSMLMTPKLTSRAESVRKQRDKTLMHRWYLDTSSLHCEILCWI
jgi:hypothetical protein